MCYRFALCRPYQPGDPSSHESPVNPLFLERPPPEMKLCPPSYVLTDGFNASSSSFSKSKSEITGFA